MIGNLDTLRRKNYDKKAYFYVDDEFTLAEMTDAYKAEWEANSDWLKIGFHAKQEFPDYFAYQPESRDKLMIMCEIFEKYGYEYIFVEDLLK